MEKKPDAAMKVIKICLKLLMNQHEHHSDHLNEHIEKIKPIEKN